MATNEETQALSRWLASVARRLDRLPWVGRHGLVRGEAHEATVTQRLPDPLSVGYAIGGIAWCAMLAVGSAPYGTDALAYRHPANPDLYSLGFGGFGSYHYSPAFAQLVGNVGSLASEPVFVAVWTGMLFVALRGLVGRWAIFALLFPPVAVEIFAGNTHLILAGVVVFGFRRPWLWSIALLTKLTPGVGLLWFLARGEWRSLAIAIGTTALIALASFAAAPGLWRDWIALLLSASSENVPAFRVIALPIAVRVAAAAVLVIWGARSDRAWVVPVGSMLALPTIFFGSLSMLLAIPALYGRGQTGRWSPRH